MNLKIMSLLPGFRYSSIAAPGLTGHDASRPITVDVSQQIPRRQAGVTLRRGLAYHGRLRLDLLTPTRPGRYPLVVYLPGGGFAIAPRGTARPEREFIAAAGYAVASAEYRIVRQGATYVEGLADIAAAISYLADHAAELHIDPGRTAVWGESAGGYLASMAGLTDARVTAVVDLFGASDLSRIGEGFDPRIQAAAAHPRHPVRRYRATEANPIDHIGPSVPTFLILHGDDDRIIPPAQTQLLHRALRTAGGDSTHYLLAGAGHGRLALSRRQAKQWTSQQVMTIIKDFLDAHLRS